MLDRLELKNIHDDFEKNQKLDVEEHIFHKRVCEIFLKFIRSGDFRGDQYRKDILRILNDVKKHPYLNAKNLLTNPGESGGHAVPKIIADRINFIEQRISPVRRIVGNQKSATGDYSQNLSRGSEAAAWASETGSRLTTGSATLRTRSGNFGTLYARPKVSEWALDDIPDLESWLVDEAVQQFAVTEGADVINGNGTNKPTGMLNTTPVTTADDASPERAAGVYQYVPSDTALSPASPGIVADALITLYVTVNAAYRANGTWVMNSATLAAVLKLKDSLGQYLSLLSVNPANGRYRLLGRPIEIWENLDDIGANNFPIGFGDFNRAYTLVDRNEMSIIRDPLTEPGFINFYIARRETGFVNNDHAAKFLRTL